MAVEVGDRAPGFALRDQHGRTVSLAAYAGKQAVVVVFYPFAFSGVCSAELREIRDAAPLLAADDVATLAISCDPMFSLRAFADQEGLEFPLLSDFWPHGAVSRAFGAFDEERGCSSRSSFVVDRAGVVRWQVHNALPDARDLEDHRRVLARLRE